MHFRQCIYECSSPRRETRRLFRIQFLCAAPAGLSVLNEVEIRATDVSVAIVSAARLTFPPKTVAVRILDHGSQIVFERHKADRR